MKKSKLLLTVCVLMVGFVSSSFAVRLGLEFGDPAAVAILRLNSVDFKLGYNFEGLSTNNAAAFIHASADYRIIETGLIDFLNIYLGAGLFAQITTGDNSDFTFGGRIPVGINTYLLKGTLEIFLEAVPTVRVVPSLGWGGFQGWLGFTIPLPKM